MGAGVVTIVVLIAAVALPAARCTARLRAAQRHHPSAVRNG